jgi:hypothetical protein
LLPLERGACVGKTAIAPLELIVEGGLVEKRRRNSGEK